MALNEYRKKRSFDKTSEPSGRGGTRTKRGAASLSFVIQKHDASHLHYDLRLEMDGVLRSWAVPKGPSLDPADKHLAVEVEDHPLEYGSFEGTIPQGQYGGGTVMLWDRGTWEPSAGTDAHESWRAGRLSFTLHGEKLMGKWLLVRMNRPGSGGKPQWLLRKVDDTHARVGAKGDVRVLKDRSVASDRSMDEIAGAADRTWRSGRARLSKARKAAPVRATSTRTRTHKSDAAAIPGAVAAPMPPTVDAQLATLVEHAPEGEDWLHEVKFDGYRILAHVSKGGVRLVSRNGKDWTDRLAEVARSVAALGLRSAVLDGEVVVMDKRGVSSFQELQGTLKARGKPLSYYVFDVCYLDGYDLRQCELRDRRRVLEGLLAGSKDRASARSAVRYSDAIRGHGSDVLRNACHLALEGVISKRLDSQYEGARTRAWVKSKCIGRQEMVIVGFTDPRRTRTGMGALLLGYHASGDLHYAGKVGTGFTEGMLRGILERLKPLEQETSAVIGPPRGAAAKGVHWVKPTLVAEVEFTEWTRDGSLRHPSFVGLREDKDAHDVTREASVPSATRAKRGPKARRLAAQILAPRMSSLPESKGTRAKEPEADVGTRILGVTLTHPDKILFPEHGVTKHRLAQYYAAVGERMIEYIAGRPLMLTRCPAGQRGACFYQKNWEDELPPGSHGVVVEEANGKNTYFVADTAQSLVWLVQRGALEIHAWGSTEKNLELPDRIVLDLDPAPDVPWNRVVAGAIRTRELLLEVGLECFVKTTGGKGLHVVAPLRPKAGWDRVKAFSRGIAQALVQENSKEYIATASKAKRPGKVFLDYLRNGRGATSVAPYSTRARPGATVSLPLSWKELESLKSRPEYTLEDAEVRVKRADPWVGMRAVRQSLKAE